MDALIFNVEFYTSSYSLLGKTKIIIGNYILKNPQYELSEYNPGSKNKNVNGSNW